MCVSECESPGLCVFCFEYVKKFGILKELQLVSVYATVHVCACLCVAFCVYTFVCVGEREICAIARQSLAPRSQEH